VREGVTGADAEQVDEVPLADAGHQRPELDAGRRPWRGATGSRWPAAVAFLAAARGGSFTAAGAELGLAQASIKELGRVPAGWS
jgi:hypothetical protein